MDLDLKKINKIGIGTQSMAGDDPICGYGPANDNNSLKTLEYALELGINWIDTAPNYGQGHAEKLISNHQDRFFIFTKCGIVWNEKGQTRRDLSPIWIRKDLENSLKRLKRDYIDGYMIHWVDPLYPITRSWEILIELKNDKVRYIGISNLTIKQLRTCHAIYPIDFVQYRYNLIDRQVEKDVVPFCKENNIPFFAYSPLKSGLLFENFNSNYHPNDWRNKNSNFYGKGLENNLILANELKKQTDLKLEQYAIKWLLDKNVYPIIGTKNKKKLEVIMG